MPRRADGGSLGKRTTVPSGWTKNLTRSPGFNCRWSRMGLGIVACPLLVSADSMCATPLLFWGCKTFTGVQSSCSAVSSGVGLRIHPVRLKLFGAAGGGSFAPFAVRDHHRGRVICDRVPVFGLLLPDR